MNPNRFAIPHKAEIPPGAWGVWQIPSLNVSVPLYRGNNPVTAQADVDRENSANYRRFGCGHIISDHAGSRSNGGKGVWDLWRLHPDDAAFLILPDGTQTFVCQMCAGWMCIRRPTPWTDRASIPDGQRTCCASAVRQRTGNRTISQSSNRRG